MQMAGNAAHQIAKCVHHDVPALMSITTYKARQGFLAWHEGTIVLLVQLETAFRISRQMRMI